MDDCIFCKIIKGEILSSIVYEDDDFIAFNDIHPKAKTHILLVPKKHLASVLEIDDLELAGKLIMTAKKIARDKNLSSYRLVINSGPDAGQEVGHLHMHILGGSKLGDIA